MTKRSRPAFIAEALARDDMDLVRAYARRGGQAAAAKRQAIKKTDNEDELYEQILKDKTIKRSKLRPEAHAEKGDDYEFGGHL
ncbi:MAG TPA: hypothetical protein VGE53_00510 [Candidatus Paceibacterota bacterium]